MKCVSLGTVSVRKLLKSDFTQSDVSFYTNSKHEYKTMWSQQGNEFWIKFVIVVKEILGESYDYECGTNDLDQPFIEFLDALLCVDYNSVSSYITQVGKSIAEFEALSAEKESHKQQYLQVKNKFQVVAAFVRLLPVWQNSSSGSDFQWKIPEYWFSSEAGKHKLELFIKFKWSVVDIEEMFECDRNQVGWLSGWKTEPRKKENKSSKESEFHKIENREVATTDMKQQILKGEHPMQGTKASLKWLSAKSIIRKARTKGETGNIQMLRASNNNDVRLWNLVEISLPEILHRKFHVNDITELLDEQTTCSFMGTASLYTFWDKTFGLQYLKGIQEKQFQLQKLTKTVCVTKKDWRGSKIDKKVKEWRVKVNELISSVQKSKLILYEPKGTDIASEVSEFLLEPCVIIQLPWNCVLLHQWLAVSLVEVLIFEHKSTELRHWPLPDKVVSQATELMTLVKQVKERIILGFAVMSKQVEMHPKLDRTHPAMIMDQVVLPSLATLQFLISGNATKILKSLKKISWSFSSSSASMMYVPASAYTMDDFLENVYSNLCYNFMIWEYVNVPAPFPGALFEQVDIEEVITRMNTKQTITPESNASMKPLSREEKFLCRIVDKNREAMTNSERVSIALKIIQECVIEPGRLPGLKLDQVRAYLDTEEIRSSAGFITREYDESSISDMILVSSLLFYEVYGMLIGSEKETSILACTVCQGLKVLEREQVIRLTKLLGEKFGIIPVAVNITKDISPAIEDVEMNFVLSKVTENQQIQNRDWLLNQLPDPWRRSTNSMKVSYDVLNDVNLNQFTHYFQERIGRLLFNIAKNSFDIYAKTGEVYKYWQVVQYLLPCFNASFIISMNVPKNDKARQRAATGYQMLLNELIFQFEKLYKKWLKLEVSKSPIDIKSIGRKVTIDVLTCEMNTITEHFRDRILNSFRTHIQEIDVDGEEIGICGIINMNLAMQQWTIDLCNQIRDKQNHHQEADSYYLTWSINIFEYFQLMYDVCCNIWKPPHPSNLKLQNPRLQDSYKTDVTMQAVDMIFQMLLGHVESDDINSNFNYQYIIGETIKMKCKWGMEKKVWTYKLLQAIQENKADFTREDREFYDPKIEILCKYYKSLKDAKHYLTDKLLLMNLLPNDPPEMKKAAQYYIADNMTALDKMMPLLLPVPKKISLVKSTVNETIPPQKQIPAGEVTKMCRNCCKILGKKRKFITCPQCVEQKYPDVNYYCSEQCKTTWWEKEHMAEHLEFELGLGDFADMKT